MQGEGGFFPMAQLELLLTNYYNCQIDALIVFGILVT